MKKILYILLVVVLLGCDKSGIKGTWISLDRQNAIIHFDDQKIISNIDSPEKDPKYWIFSHLLAIDNGTINYTYYNVINDTLKMLKNNDIFYYIKSNYDYYPYQIFFDLSLSIDLPKINGDRINNLGNLLIIPKDYILTGNIFYNGKLINLESDYEQSLIDLSDNEGFSVASVHVFADKGTRIGVINEVQNKLRKCYLNRFIHIVHKDSSLKLYGLKKNLRKLKKEDLNPNHKIPYYYDEVLPPSSDSSIIQGYKSGDIKLITIYSKDQIKFGQLYYCFSEFIVDFSKLLDGENKCFYAYYFDSKCLYEDYLFMKDTITDISESVKNSLAIKFFDKNYNEFNVEELKEFVNKYPIGVFEIDSLHYNNM